MSLNITFYGRRHYYWRGTRGLPTTLWRAWFHRPDQDSTGGIGFKIPFVHVCFMWGHRL